jgi:O-antigen/teichoic acid export membrane protein
VLQVVIVILAVRENLGFTVIIMSMLASSIFNFILVVMMVNKYVPLRPQFDYQYCKKFLRESAPLGISAVVIFIYFKIDTIILSILKTNADVGIYNAAYKVIENISFFPAMIIGLIFPLLARNIFTNKHEFERIANETVKVFMILVVPMVIGTLFLAPGIIHMIGGAAFIPSINTLRILIFALAFIFFGGFFNNILIAANLQKKMLYAFIACACFNVVANLIFIPLFSYTAAAIISTLTEFFVMLAGFYLTLKHVRYVPAVNHFFRITLSGLAMGLVLHILGFLAFIPLAFIGLIAYLFFLWITKTITVKEIMDIALAR